MGYGLKSFRAYLDSLNEFKFDFSLSRIKQTLKLWGNPQDSFRVIHVAGSNGKGSCAVYLTELLRLSGYRTATYLSPHLLSVNERILVNTKPVPFTEMSKAGMKLARLTKKHGLKLTYFEFLTVLAFLLFKRHKVDYAVVEAGLGGRFDATNVDYRQKDLSVITSISLEHTQYLGNTVEAILNEKKQIIGKGGCVYNIESAALRHLMKAEFGNRGFDARAMYKLADCRYDDNGLLAVLREKRGGAELAIRPAMQETAQAENVRTLAACAKVLEMKGILAATPAVIAAASRAVLKGRFTPGKGAKDFYVSVAHNPAAFSSFLNTFYAAAGSKKKVLIFSALSDKDVGAIFEIISVKRGLTVILTGIDNERAMDTGIMRKYAEKYGIKYLVERDNRKALALAKKLRGRSGMITAAGSFYLVNKYI